MTKQEERLMRKYPNTKTFQWYNANPRGRITGDCVYRAIAAGTRLPYNEVVMRLAKLQCETGWDATCPEGFTKFLASLGWAKQKQPRKWDNTKYTGDEWCKFLDTIDPFGKDYPEIIANIGGHHTVCIRAFDSGSSKCRHKILDIWNSGYKCIGNFWTPPAVRER